MRLALIGFGGVNRALVELLLAQRAAGTCGFRVTAVADPRFGTAFAADGLDLAALAALGMEDGALNALPGGGAGGNDAFAIDDAVDVLVEASFTNPHSGEPALSLCRKALATGKSVATTNKGPVAFGLAELMALAEARGGLFRFEGAVMSGTPVLRAARTCFPGAQFTEFRGILNGTSNYVLGRMETGADFAAAVAEAQAAGYAEADPTADVEGHDVRLKVAILANVLFGSDIRPADVACRGIAGLTAGEVAAACADERHWKLIGRARRRDDGTVEASVGPLRLPRTDPLAAIAGATNALTLVSEPLGATTMAGPGAGRVETAYALLADLIEIDGPIA